MNDLEKFVRELVASGKSLEDIYEDFEDIVCAIESEKETADNDRDKMMNELWDVFYRNVKDENLSVSDGVILIMLSLAEEHPEWTTDDMDEFCKQLDYCARKGADFVGKNPIETIGSLMGEIDSKLKDTVARAKKPTRPQSMELDPSDEEKIKKFLDSLF